MDALASFLLLPEIKRFHWTLGGGKPFTLQLMVFDVPISNLTSATFNPPSQNKE